MVQRLMHKKPRWHSTVYTTGITGIRDAENAWHVQKYLCAQGTTALQALYRTLTRPIFGEKPCPFCDNQSTEPSHFEHFVTCHSPFVGPEFIVELLASHDLEPCPTVWARWCKWRFGSKGLVFLGMLPLPHRQKRPSWLS